MLAFNAKKFQISEPVFERQNYKSATQRLTKHLNYLRVAQVSFTKLAQTVETAADQQPIVEVSKLRVRLDWLNASDKFADDSDQLNTIAANICGVVYW